MSLVISDASPLIGLCQIKRLHLLKDLWSKITIPEAVFREVVISGSAKHCIRRETSPITDRPM